MQPKYGSDLILDILKVYGIKYVSCNPGATFRGLHDSIVNYSGEHGPKLILCCHEEISVAIAHGYAKATGRYMAVFVHSNVGLQHASMAIFNAWCDRVPILVIGGVGPLDTSKRRPWIDWIHTSHNQAGIIHEYVKWHDQPYSLAAVPDSFHRAFKLMNSEPKAPVYLEIDALIQEQKLNKSIDIGNISNYAPPAAPHANPAALQQLAELLVEADFPIIFADYLGRDPDTVQELLKLAELLSIPVIDCGGRFNFPNNHPLCLSGVEKDYLLQADLILALDVNDIYGALGTSQLGNREYKSYINKNTKVISITLADYLVGSWAADYQKLYPVAFSIAADTKVVLSDLYHKCAQLISKTRQKSYQQRHLLIKQKHSELRNKWQAEAVVQQTQSPLPVPVVINEIWRIIKNEKWILANEGSVVIGHWLKKLWDFERPEQYLGSSGGAGLGYGIGASLGVALAHKGSDKICLDIQTDGDLLFTPSALWTATQYQIPLLIIVMNNESYNNTRLHALNIAQSRKRDISNVDVGTALDGPAVDFPYLAESFGVKSFPRIERLAEIQSTIKEALLYIKTKQRAALIDIKIRR